jgi:hypothetical protein
MLAETTALAPTGSMSSTKKSDATGSALALAHFPHLYALIANATKPNLVILPEPHFAMLCTNTKIKM